MLNEKINFGILGCGMISDFHARAIASLEDACLLGAADFDISRAEQFADKHHALKAYASYEDMLADDEIDVISICTPSGFHAENAIAALRANKHVVLEKPMALTKEDAERVTKACEESGKLLTVICQLRFSEDIARTKELVSSGAFGKLAFCNLSMKYWRSPEYYAGGGWKGTKKMDGGGALMNQGIHGVDALLYIAGDAKLIAAKSDTLLHQIEVEDRAVAMLEFANGAFGTIEASTCVNPGFERRIEIAGTDGCAVLRESTLEKLVVGGQVLIDGNKEEIAGTANDPSAMGYELHAKQIQNLIRAIRGEEKLLIDAREGQRAVRLITDIYEASK